VSALLRIGVDDALAIVARYCGKTSETYRYVAHDVTELAKAVATIEGLATPPAGAGEAVAWMLRWTGVFTEEGKSHFYTDKKAADRMAETVRDSYGCPDVEVTPLYAAPTPLPEAVRELVAADLEFDAARIFHTEHTMHHPRPFSEGAPGYDRLCEAKQRRAIALRALTGGDKQGEANG
jgi:hypothetical protein